MPRWLWGFITFQILWLTGCQSSRSTASDWLDRLRAPWNGIGPDTNQIEFAIVQEELGSDFLMGQLWQNVDEQIIPIEHRDEFEQNGLRVGLIKGSSSATLQKMLTSPESCPIAQRVMVAVNKEFHLPLRQGAAEPLLTLVQAGEPQSMPVTNGEYGLVLKLTLAENGQVQVKAVPYVKRRQDLTKLIQPNEDRSGWKLPEDMQEERFEHMGWQVTLGPKDFLIVGSELEKNDRFGQHCFVDASDKKQKILVIRGVNNLDPLPRGKIGQGPIPLAWQAIMPNTLLLKSRQELDTPDAVVPGAK